VIAWLLGHQSALQSALLIVAFAAIAVWESFVPRRAPTTPTAARWLNNIVLAGTGGALTRLCLPLIGVEFAVFASANGWGLLNVLRAPGWLSFVVALVLLDLAEYGLHRLVHRVPVLWRLHKVHHSDLDVDCLTAVRHHPLEFLFAGAARLVAIGLLGAPAIAVLAWSMLDSAMSFFNHGNIAMSLRSDRALRRLIVTPDTHRIHHSLRDDECNGNFSMVFPWWDHCFGTWRAAPRLGHIEMRVGIAEAQAPRDVTLASTLLMPFRRERAAIAA
jgi:sterol desaturase/sphingolipid hydroxylase (fatty acid hydroxylase superfamily)